MKNKLGLTIAVTSFLLAVTNPAYPATVNTKGVTLDEDRITEATNNGTNDDKDWRPTGKGFGKPDATAPTRHATIAQNGINYHNGPVMATPNIYYIWYGSWAGNNAVNILDDLASALGGSPYFNINKTYSTSTIITGLANFKSETTVTAPLNTVLSDAQVQSIVSNAITSNALPKDPAGVYFVLTSKDINESSGFCTQYCGWHTHATISGADIKFAFVGNPERCPSSCAAQTTGPNGNAGADGMASVIAHELEETVTDPDLNGWYDTKGNENADKCAWTFGTTSVAANGAKYNMTLGARQFLIQQNWVNAVKGTQKGYCALQ